MWRRGDYTRALISEHGVQAICATTGETYIPKRVRLVDGLLWCDCGRCDTSRGTGAAYDAARPQPHPIVWEAANAPQ